MLSTASMTKEVPVSAELGDMGFVGSKFKRNGGSVFRGVARFGTEDKAIVLLEVMDTPDGKAKGMMGRTRTPECCGMLFKDLTGGFFWMKGCLVPLDIVFLKDGRVSRLYTMDADGGEERHAYSSDEKDAIELPAGFCERHGVEVGTKCVVEVW